MPTFMVQASYTSPAWNKLVQRPENRMEALRPVVEKLGGEIIAWYYAFGDYDVVVLFDVPSNINAAAFSMAIAGSGAEVQVGVGAGGVGDEDQPDRVVVQEDHLLDQARGRLGRGHSAGKRDQRDQDTEGDEPRHGRSPHRGSTGYPRLTHPRNPSARTLAFW